MCSVSVRNLQLNFNHLWLINYIPLNKVTLDGVVWCIPNVHAIVHHFFILPSLFLLLLQSLFLLNVRFFTPTLPFIMHIVKIEYTH